jgi:hypothetical protein
MDQILPAQGLSNHPFSILRLTQKRPCLLARLLAERLSASDVQHIGLKAVLGGRSAGSEYNIV